MAGLTWRVEHADCIEAMREMGEASVDAIVTDPPYGLEFMGKEWDRLGAVALQDPAEVGGFQDGAGGNPYSRRIRYGATVRQMQEWHHAWATEALRVLKPGGHLLAFGGTRTYHRLACAVEDAGFEIRDSLIWLYGQGFPKSLNVGCRCENGGRHAGGEPKAEHDLSRLRGGDVPEAKSATGGEGSLLLAGVQESSAPADGAMPPARRAGQSQRLMEGRGNDLAEGGQLPADQVRPSARVGEADGAEGRLSHGASTTHGADDGAPPIANGGRTPLGSRPDEQRAQEPRTLADEPGSQAGGGWPICSRCGLPAAGLGTALKPAHEPIVVARKPLIGTVAANVQAHGTGALNIDGCRIEHADADDFATSQGKNPGRDDVVTSDVYGAGRPQQSVNGAGRWPANVVLSHLPECEQVGTRKVKAAGFERSRPDRQTGTIYGEHQPSEFTGHADPDGTETVPAYRCAENCPVAELDAQSGESKSAGGQASLGAFRNGDIYGAGRDEREQRDPGFGDTGGASRFFYVAKASRAERNAGLTASPDDAPVFGDDGGTYQGLSNSKRPQSNAHPTVKPIDLMRWLVRLVTPPGGTVLDPFVGSGTTGCAAVLEGVNFVGIEREAEYVELARARIEWWAQHRGREAEEVLAISRRSDTERERLEAMGQLGLGIEVEAVAKPANEDRAGEESAERRYTDRGRSNFAMKPGRRRAA